jgi:hypothetical protein
MLFKDVNNQLAAMELLSTHKQASKIEPERDRKKVQTNPRDVLGEWGEGEWGEGEWGEGECAYLSLKMETVFQRCNIFARDNGPRVPFRIGVKTKTFDLQIFQIIFQIFFPHAR